MKRKRLGRPPLDRDVERTTVLLDVKLKRQAETFASKHQRSLGDLIAEALKLYMEGRR